MSGDSFFFKSLDKSLKPLSKALTSLLYLLPNFLTFMTDEDNELQSHCTIHMQLTQGRFKIAKSDFVPVYHFKR
jgi:hypothetical protein